MKLIRSLLVIPAALILTSCGGGSSNDSVTGSININAKNDGITDDGNIGVRKTAKFFDAPTEGVDYRCGNISGKTNSEGEFQFIEGDECTFSIGKVSLGIVAGVPPDLIVTPYDLAGTSRLFRDSPAAIGIAQLLQSLDTDATLGKISISDLTRRLLESIPATNLSQNRLNITEESILKIINDAGFSTLVNRSDALQHMETFFSSIGLDRTMLPPGLTRVRPMTNSRLQYIYKYGWKVTDSYGFFQPCSTDGNNPDCLPTYFTNDCQGWTGCQSTYLRETNIGGRLDRYVYRAFPIMSSRSFSARFLGLGVGGAIPEFVKVYSSRQTVYGPVEMQFTPPDGPGPNQLIGESKAFDVYFHGEWKDFNGKSHMRHPGDNLKTPGFQVHFNTPLQIEVNQIYWIVVKYLSGTGDATWCQDYIGPNQFSLPSDFSTDSVMPYGPIPAYQNAPSNGFAYTLASVDGVEWRPWDGLSGGVCNTFLAD